MQIKLRRWMKYGYGTGIPIAIDMRVRKARDNVKWVCMEVSERVVKLSSRADAVTQFPRVPEGHD